MCAWRSHAKQYETIQLIFCFGFAPIEYMYTHGNVIVQCSEWKKEIKPVTKIRNINIYLHLILSPFFIL